MDTQTQEHKHHVIRNVIIAIAAIGLMVVGMLSYKNPALYKATLTGGADDTSVDTDLYIANDYRASAGDSFDIEVRAGKTLTNLQSYFAVDLNAPISQIEILSVSTTGTVLNGLNPYTYQKVEGRYAVMYYIPTPIATVNDNAVLLKFSVHVKDGVTPGSTIIFDKQGGDNTYWRLQEGGLSHRVPSFREGKITIGTTEDICKSKTCPEHSLCDSTTGNCVCNKGYDPKYLCSACDEANGYTGYPNCKKDTLSNLNGLVLTLSQDTISKLSSEDRGKAYSTVYLLINSPAAAGQTISFEGRLQPIPSSSEVECISSPAQIKKCVQDITYKLKQFLIVSGVNASIDPNVAGLIKMEAITPNPDMSLDGISTTSGDVIIVPGMANKLILNPTMTYQLRVIGKNSNDGSKTELTFNDVKWMPQPMNRLSDTALKGGLLEKGDKSGVTPLYAQIEKADGSKIDSNQMTIEVPSGPIVEYIHIIGSNAIERGGRINLSVKISDVDQISDIKDIRTSIIRSSQTTYAGLNADTSAVWFTATPYKEQVATTDSGTQQTSGEGEGEGEGEAVATTEYYKIYTIPVDVPQDVNLTNGPYKLLLEITDTAGHIATSVLPITLGATANGDVNNDGNISMLDVILAFQFANGSSTPTDAQLKAADMNSDTKITMLDVITLFNKLSS